MWGIDVSHYQESIDWRSVTAEGIQFAILKAMNETTHQPDPRFNYNYDQANKYGLDIGIYIYVTATDLESGYIEAMDTLKIIHGRKLFRGVWLDMESPKIAKLGESRLTEVIKVETTVLNSGGYDVGIYSNLDWYNRVLDGAELNKTYPWWLARYPKNDTGVINLSLKPDKSLADMWQYSSKGSIKGIKGPVDLDFDVADLGKDVESVAQEVVSGMWGNGDARKNRLVAAGYDYEKIRTEVNKLIWQRDHYPVYTGHSLRIDEVFKAIGVEPEYIGSKYKRKPIAVANGIADYDGTLIQNIKMIALAKKGDLKRIR